MPRMPYLPMLTSTPRTRFAPTTGIIVASASPARPREGEESGVEPVLLPPRVPVPAALLDGDVPLDTDGGGDVA